MEADFEVPDLLGGSLKPCSKPPVAVPMPDILPEEITDMLTSLESTLQTTFSRFDVLCTIEITLNTICIVHQRATFFIVNMNIHRSNATGATAILVYGDRVLWHYGYGNKTARYFLSTCLWHTCRGIAQTAPIEVSHVLNLRNNFA